MKRGQFLLILLIGIFLVNFSQLVLAFNSESSSSTEWRMFGRFLNHTRFTDSSSPANISNASVATYTAGDVFYSSPAVSNGYVYVGSGDGKLYQLNASNVSQLIASYTTGDFVYSSPAVSNGYVYVGSFDDKLYQLNASNVSQIISDYATAGDIYSSPAVSNGYVYVGSLDNKLYQLNASNVSQLILSYLTGASVKSSPAVSNGYVYVGSGDGKLYQLNASDVSQLISDYATADEIYSSPAVSNGYVYVGSNDNNLYQLNASNVSQLIASYTTGGDVFSSPAVANGYLYVGSNDTNLYQLNASNVSQLIASYTTGDFVYSSPAVSNGYVYVGSNDNNLYQLNASNVSQLIASYTTGGDVFSSPAVAGGAVYVGSFDNKLYQFGNYFVSGSTSKNGLISTNSSATPFWTNESNPREINLNSSQSQVVIFWVNATGNLGETYEFFAFANITSNLSISNITGRWNVTIVSSSETDTTSPLLTIISPTATTYTNSLINFNISANENLSFCKYSIDSWATNVTMTSLNTTYYYNITTVADGSYTARFWCNDTSNNINNTQTVAFSVGTSSSLGISFVSPTLPNSTTTLNRSFIVNISLTNTGNLSTLTYNFNNTNYSLYDDSLVVMYNFDNYTRLNDTSKYGGSASFAGSADFTNSGKYGKAIDLPGGSDYVDLGSMAWGSFRNLTVSMWVHSDSTPVHAGLFSYYVDNDHRMDLRITQESPTLKFGAYCVGGGVYGVTSNLEHDNSLWHYVVLEFGDGGQKLYVDGVLDNSNANTCSIDNIGNNGATWVGSMEYSSAPSGTFDGQIDEVRVWNRTLTSEEIYQGYVSNLVKLDANSWNLYVNQSKNLTSGLDNGTYTYQAFASNLSGNANQTDLRTIIIGTNADTTSPVVSLISPSNDTSTTNTTISFSCNATDNINLANLTLYVWNSSGAINYTNTSQVSGTFNQSSWNVSLGIENYSWNCLAYDNSSNFDLAENYSLAITATLDVTTPYFTYIPSGTSITYLASFGVNFSATDETAFGTFAVNDSKFSINSSGFLKNDSVLAVGVYYLNITINDTSNNINSTIYNLNVTRASSLVYTYLNNSRSNISIVNGSSILLNATRQTGEGIVKLYNNGTLINSGTAISNLTLFSSVGLYNITSIYEETQNYSASFETFFVNVTPPVVSLKIDNITADVYAVGEARITFSANKLVNASVNYGITNALGTNATNTTYSSNSQVLLSGLDEGREYSYNVTACTSENECVTSGTFSFLSIIGLNLTARKWIEQSSINLQGAGNDVATIVLNLTVNNLPDNATTYDHRVALKNYTGIDVILVSDVSGSMTGARLTELKTASKAFIDRMNSSRDRVGLVTFADTAQLKSNLTNNFASVKARIDNLYAQGSTAMGDGIKKAVQEFQTRGNSSKIWAIVLLSDGYDNPPSALRNPYVYPGVHALNASSKNISSFTIGFTDVNGYGVDEILLQNISAITGGEYYRNLEGSNLTQLYLDIQSKLVNLTNIQLIESVVIQDILMSGFNDLAQYDRYPFLVSVGNTTLLQWKTSNLGVNQSVQIKINVSTSTLLGNQETNLFPDSKVDYNTSAGKAMIVFSRTYLNINSPLIMFLNSSMQKPGTSAISNFRICNNASIASNYSLNASTSCSGFGINSLPLSTGILQPQTSIFNSSLCLDVSVNVSLPSTNATCNLILLNATGIETTNSGIKYGTASSGMEINLTYPYPYDVVITPGNITFNFSVAYSGNIDSCNLLLNGTISQTKTGISAGENFFSANVSDGTYNWSVQCSDTSIPFSQNSSQRVLFVDIDAGNPLIEFVSPTNSSGTRLYVNSTLVNVSVTDENFMNLTLYLYNSSGLVRSDFEDNFQTLLVNYSNLADGTYYFNATTYDVLGNVNSSETRNITIFTGDSILPYFTYIPENATLNYSQALLKDFNATDDINLSCFAVNDSRFKINCDGLLENNSVLAVGNYNLNITINDTTNNLNSTLYFVNVTQIIPTLTLSSSNNWNVSYGIGTNITGECNSLNPQLTCLLYKDNLLVDNSQIWNLSQGTYNFTYNTTGNVNYSSYSVSYLLSVNSTYSLVYAYINNSRTNFTATNNSALNIYLNGSLVSGTGNIELWLNGTILNNGTSPLFNITNLSVGNYNFSVIYRGNTNYSGSSETFWISVREFDVNAPVVNLTSPADSYTSTSLSVTFSYNVSDENELNNCSLIINNNITSYNSSYVNKSLTNSIAYTFAGNGNYNWSVNCTDIEGNTGNSSTRNIIISYTASSCGDGTCSSSESCSSCSADCGSCGGGGGGGLPPTCSNECVNGTIEKDCLGNDIRTRTCGNYDNDNCTEWNSYLFSTCGDNAYCENGNCILNETACVGEECLCSPELVPGWNFKSLCKKPAVNNIINILGNSYDRVSYVLAWNKNTQQYEVYSKQSSLRNINSLVLDENHSYFYYLDNGYYSLNYSGELYGSLDIDIPANKWEAPSYVYVNRTILSGKNPNLFGLTGIDYALRWNTSSQKFEVYSSLSENSRLSLEQGDGIFVFANKAGKIKYNNSGLSVGGAQENPRSFAQTFYYVVKSAYDYVVDLVNRII